jgi:rhamnosyltransferase
VPTDVEAKRAILFVVGQPSSSRPWRHQSVWYRVVGPGTALRERGWSVFYALQNEEDRICELLHLVPLAAVVLHRGEWSRSFQMIREWTKKRGVPLWYDVDDNIFNPAAIESAAHLGHLSDTQRNDVKTWTSWNRQCLSACDGGLFSCNELTKEAVGTAPRARTFANFLPSFLTSAGTAHREGRTKEFVIYYGPGSIEHAVHLAAVLPALSSLMRRHSRISVVLGGGLPRPAQLVEFGRRVEILPRISPEEYFRRLCLYDLVIAPLQLDAFSKCKSWIKPLEAAAQGIPWLGSECPSYREFQTNSKSGITVADDQWENALEEAFARRAVPPANGANRAAILAEYSMSSRVREYVEVLSLT